MKILEILYLELTNICNCSCLTCPRSLTAVNGRPKGYMNFDLFCKLIDQAYEITNTVNISYFGEHTLHPQFIDFMNFLGKRRGLNVTLYTNFLNITKEYMDSIVRARIDNLIISVDAANSDVYDILRCGKTCIDLDGKTHEENILNILDEKLKYWFKRDDHVPTRFEFTISHYNIKEVKLFIEKWVPFLSIRDSIITKVVLTYGGSILNEPFLLENNCNMWESKILVVTWDGKIGPCFLDTNMDLCVGDVNENSLTSIINSDKYNKIKTLSKSRISIPCKKCMDASNRKRDHVYTYNSKWIEECDNYLNLFKK